ncbi:MAG: hypothetical protein K6F37_04395 [Lachnospiraceae bacterium]|nr:hypothetical protein [Lachnospiraceae bacterium]
MINGISGFGSSGYNNISGSSFGIGGASPTDDVKGIGNTNNEAASGVAGECQTCKNRKYQDGSDENVSFKSAAHISPSASAATVMGHEKEHVANAYTKAAQNNGKVISAGVTLHMARCPECGRTYVSGGVTRTLIKYNKDDESPYAKMKKAEDADSYTGLYFDTES